MALSSDTGKISSSPSTFPTGRRRPRLLHIYSFTSSFKLQHTFLSDYITTRKEFINTIVNRGEWFGSSANIKGANKDAKI